MNYCITVFKLPSYLVGNLKTVMQSLTCNTVLVLAKSDSDPHSVPSVPTSPSSGEELVYSTYTMCIYIHNMYTYTMCIHILLYTLHLSDDGQGEGMALRQQSTDSSKCI